MNAVLGGVLGVGGVAADHVGGAEGDGLMAFDEHPEGAVVPRAGTRGQVGVGGLDRHTPIPRRPGRERNRSTRRRRILLAGGAGPPRRGRAARRARARRRPGTPRRRVGRPSSAAGGAGRARRRLGGLRPARAARAWTPAAARSSRVSRSARRSSVLGGLPHVPSSNWTFSAAGTHWNDQPGTISPSSPLTLIFTPVERRRLVRPGRRRAAVGDRHRGAVGDVVAAVGAAHLHGGDLLGGGGGGRAERDGRDGDQDEWGAHARLTPRSGERFPGTAP